MATLPTLFAGVILFVADSGVSCLVSIHETDMSASRSLWSDFGKVCIGWYVWAVCFPLFSICRGASHRALFQPYRTEWMVSTSGVVLWTK